MLPASVCLIGVSAIAMTGVRYVRTTDQKYHDGQRDSFIVTVPQGLEFDRLNEWIRHVNATYKPGLSRYKGIPTCVFSIVATAASTTHRIDLPHSHADALVAQLRGIIPGTVVRPDSGAEKEPWRYVRELAHSNPGRTLDIQNAELFASGILHSFHPLYRSEAVSIQIIVSPAVPQAPPAKDEVHMTHDFSWGAIIRRFWFGSAASKAEVADRADKLAEPNLLGMIRIASRAETEAQAKHLVERVVGAYASADNHATHIKHRHAFMQWFETTRKILHRRFIEGHAPLAFGSQFTVAELGALMGWPLGETYAPGLPQGHARQLPATEEVARTGRVIGISNFEGQQRSLAVSAKNRSRHMQVVGQSGSGKTTLLHNLITQDLEAGSGIIVIDPKDEPDGNLFDRILNSIPDGRTIDGKPTPDRRDDVIIVDVNDVEYPVGFNVLQGDPSVVTSNIQAFFEHLYPEDARRVDVRKSFFHVLMTVMLTKGVPGPLTLADVEALCTPMEAEQAFSKAVIEGVSDNFELEGFWRQRKNEGVARTAQYFSPLLNRLWQLTSRRQLKNIIGQPASGFDMYEAIRTKKIILVNLSGQSDDVAELFGSLFLNAVWRAVRAGAANPKDPTFIYLDEFQKFINMPVAPQDWFTQARALGLNVTAAHQSLSQLGRELRDATRANIATTIFLGQSVQDAIDFAHDFGGPVTKDQLVNQHAWEFTGKLATDKGISWPVTGKTYPAPPSTRSAKEARRRSRAKYSRPVAKVEAEIRRRHLIEVPTKIVKPTPRKWNPDEE